MFPMKKGPSDRNPSLISMASGFLLLAVLIGCSKDDQNSEQDPDSFDRKGMLTNIGKKRIIPNYQELLDRVDTLRNAVDRFTADPGMDELSSARLALKKSWTTWQKCSPYQFGPGKDNIIRENVNTFPTDTNAIARNIDSGDYDLSSFTAQDQKGFPALDHLLFRKDGDSSKVLDRYRTAGDAEKRKTYLKDVVADLRKNVSTVLNGWKSNGGDYIDTWTSKTGTDKGSSLGLLVNELNFDHEIIKNGEIGIPLGKKNLGTPLPEKTQAYYSGLSLHLSKAHLKGTRDLYLGKGTDGDKLGLDDHLEHANAKHDGKSLDQAIQDQFKKTLSTMKSIQEPLRWAVKNEPQPVDDTHSELQKEVALLKTDMPSALGVLITYQDNDGD